MIHLQDFTFTGFLQFQKLLVASSSFIDFKVTPTCVTNHYKFTIHLTFSEDSFYFVSFFRVIGGVNLIMKICALRIYSHKFGYIGLKHVVDCHTGRHLFLHFQHSLIVQFDVTVICWFSFTFSYHVSWCFVFNR